MKKLFKKLKNKKGFTLVESMVAIGILSIASIIFATFLSTSTNYTLMTLQNEEDYLILQQAISTGNYEGVELNVTTQKTDAEGNRASFSIIFDSEASVNVKGEYVIVENPKTNQHFVLFVGDRYLGKIDKDTTTKS